MNKNTFDVNSSCGSHLIARRLVKDYCTYVTIGKELLQAACGARS